MTQQSGEPNLSYEFTGDGIQITYIPSNDHDQPELDYQDSQENRTFGGNEVSSEKRIFGTQLTVLLKEINFPDYGSRTTLTLLLPDINLGRTTEQHFKTLAIRTVDTFSGFSGVPFGARQTYRVYNLEGTARLAATTTSITLTVDATSYHISDPIVVTLSNQSTQTIEFPDHLTECSVIQLQRQEDGSWKEVSPCLKFIATLIHKLEAGQSLNVELVSSSENAGLHRATLSYRTSDASDAQTIFSQAFQVQATPDVSS
jgi:hypothetical protein